MTRRTLTFKLDSGLHMRPAGRFAEVAMDYVSQVYINCGDKHINGKSLLGILSLGIRKDDKYTIVCEGEDEKEAMAALVTLIKNGFE